MGIPRPWRDRLSHLPHILVRALSKGHTEHIGEAGGLVRFSRVITVHGLVDVALKVRLGDEMVRAEHHALEVGPKALYGVGGNAALGILLNPVTDNAVNVSLAREAVVGGELVREHLGVVGHELLDNRHKGLGPRVLHLHGADGALALYHTENRGLGLRAAALRLLRPLGLVLVGLAPAEIHLVHFHLAPERGRIVLRVEGAYLVENVPRGLLRDVEVTAELAGGYPLLVGGNEVHGNEPLAQGNLRVLEDSADGDGEVPLAVVAAVAAVLALRAVMPAAVGADHVVLCPTGVAYRSAAALLGAEVVGECENGVEVLEVNHSKIPCVLGWYMYLYLKRRGFFHEIQSFFCYSSGIYADFRVN